MYLTKHQKRIIRRYPPDAWRGLLKYFWQARKARDPLHGAKWGPGRTVIVHNQVRQDTTGLTVTYTYYQITCCGQVVEVAPHNLYDCPHCGRTWLNGGVCPPRHLWDGRDCDCDDCGRYGDRPGAPRQPKKVRGVKPCAGCGSTEMTSWRPIIRIPYQGTLMAFHLDGECVEKAFARYPAEAR